MPVKYSSGFTFVFTIQAEGFNCVSSSSQDICKIVEKQETLGLPYMMIYLMLDGISAADLLPNNSFHLE